MVTVEIPTNTGRCAGKVCQQVMAAVEISSDAGWHAGKTRQLIVLAVKAPIDNHARQIRQPGQAPMGKTDVPFHDKRSVRLLPVRAAQFLQCLFRFGHGAPGLRLKVYAGRMILMSSMRIFSCYFKIIIPDQN